MNQKQFSKLTHCLAIISIVLALALQNTAALPQIGGVQPALAASSQPGIPDNWLAQAQENIRLSEYNISWADQSLIAGAPPSYQAPNRAQNLRFYFQENGLQVIRRTEAEPTWLWGLTLSSLGRGAQSSAVEQPALNVAGNQVAYHRQALREVYTNTDLGLLQSFHLDARPVPGNQALVLHLGITGDLTAHAQVGGGFEFRQHGLAVLSYGSLQAQDTNGKSLPVEAHINTNLNAQGTIVTALQLVIDEQQAKYPLSIQASLTGMSTTPAWTATGTQNNAFFGASVATAGDVNGDGFSDVLVGIPYYDYNYQDSGAAFLYFGSVNGPGSSPGWYGAGSHAGDNYGQSVATAGDINGDSFSDILVSAPAVDGLSGSNIGMVYAHYGSPYGPASAPDWIYNGNQEDAYSGFSIATAGDVNGDGYSDVIVGVHLYDTSLDDVGCVLIFHGSVSGLTEDPVWSKEGVSAWGYLGYSVATAGDVNGDGYADVIIGAPGAYTSGAGLAGTAYLHFGSPSGIQNSGHLLFEGRAVFGQFGYSVSTAGDLNGDGYADIIIGAPTADIFDDYNEKGEVHVYYGSSAMDNNIDWSVLSYEDFSHLGNSVATAGDINGDGFGDIIIGQEKFDGGFTDRGCALVWLGRSGGMPGSWQDDEFADWRFVLGDNFTQYGHSVATAGDVNGDGYSDILVGAPYYQVSGDTKGLAAIYYGAAQNLSQTPNWTNGGDQAFSNLGFSVASAGDVDGDGFADVIAGAPDYDATYTDEGAVYFWFGSANGLNWSFDWWAVGGLPGARFGASVDSAGDVNGDGYSDIIVGAPNYNISPTEEGMVFVWLGSSTGLGNPYNADWVTDGSFSGFSVPEIGAAVAAAGDVNGDGYGDIAIGAPQYYEQIHAGLVMVWHGGPAGLGASYRDFDWHAEGSSNWKLGLSVAGAGDVNRDGYNDLIAGGQNLAAVWHGSGSGLSKAGTSWVRTGIGSFGLSVDTAGDINGDGYSDVIVGAPLETFTHNQDGMAYAFCGSASGLATAACWMDSGLLEGAQFGYAVSAAGDVNGDGYSDFLVGAPWATHPTAFEGQVHLYYGKSGGPISFQGSDWLNESSTEGANLGWSVSSAGDINGDGYADVLAGAKGMSSGRGEVQLYYGNGAPGRLWLPRQYQPDCATPLHNLGRAGYGNSFCMKIIVFDPMGRGDFRLIYEVKPLQQVFNGAAFYDGDYWFDTSTAATQTRQVYDLTPGKRTHWRVRITYSPVTSPFAPPHSRWMHIPWNGWNEADLYQSINIFIPLLRK